MLRAIPPLAWLTGIVAVSIALLALESSAFPMPIIVVDEFVYTNAAKRLALGSPPGINGADYGYGLIYPLLLAPLYRVFAHTGDAYTTVKLANAVAFSLTAVPAFLLARRVARPGLALGVALLTLLLPARAYVPLVLTESVSFLVFLVAVLAAVRALERPTVGRQLVMLGLCAVAFETRRQFVVLVVAVPLMFVLGAVVERGPASVVARRIVSRYAVTWIALGAAAAGVIAWSTVRGESLAAGLGPYAVLARSYDVVEVSRWFAYHAGAYGLSVAVIPLIALPFGLATCLRRDAPATHRSVGLATVVLLPLLLAQVAAFSSTPYGLHRIHERYLFYVAPLVLAMLARWIDAGLPGARSAAAVLVAAVVVASPLLLPLHGLATFAVDAPVLDSLGYGLDAKTSFQLVALWVSAFLCVWVFLLRPRHGFILLAVVAVALAPVDIGVHAQFARESRKWEEAATGARTGRPRDWLDGAIGRRAPVALLVVAPPSTCASEDSDYAHVVTSFWRTAFFNSGVRRVIGLDLGLDIGVPVQSAVLDAGGRLIADGRPVTARYLVADARIRLDGRLIDQDPATGLALWKTSGAVRVFDVPPGGALGALVCGSVRRATAATAQSS